ncbi:MAG: hypothetical protein RIB63_05700 [Fulvivirga sp.]
MRKTFFSDHDRSRRTKSVDLLQFWTSNLSQKSSLARKIVESFDDNQCKSLAEQESFNVDSNKSDILNEYFHDAENKLETKGNTVRLNDGHSSILRWDAISYLNQLEAVLSAWRNNVADRKIIEEEFDYLYDPQKGHSILERFRTATGIDSYPAIKEFVEYIKCLKDKSTDKGKGTSKI